MFNDQTSLLASTLVREPKMITFFLKTDSLDNMPCCYCSVEDPSLLEIDCPEGGPFLLLFLGMWSQETVSAWCRDLITLGAHYNAHDFRMTNGENATLLVYQSGGHEIYQLELVAPSLYDLPCEICQFSEPPPVELEKKSGLGREFHMKLGEFSNERLYDFCTRLRVMLSFD